MAHILTGDHWSIRIGDNRQTLSTVPDGSVHAVVTSPPYFGLRSYHTGSAKDQELGCEPTLEAYLANQMTVFDAVWRVLREDGVCLVNLGDSYADDSKWGGTTGGKHAKGLHGDPVGRRRATTDVAACNQCLVPHRFALAMQDRGWVLRSTVIWHKRSPMPESLNGVRWARCRLKVRAAKTPRRDGHHSEGYAELRSIPVVDHPKSTYLPCPGCAKCRDHDGWVLRRGAWRWTNAFEYVFLFTKGMAYFGDAEAAKEPAVGDAPGNQTHKGADAYRNGDRKLRRSAGLADVGPRKWRNPRNVLAISHEPSKEKHFAAFPTALVYRCLKPFISPAGCCVACVAQYAPRVESDRVPTRPGEQTKVPGRNSRMFQDRDPQHDSVYREGRYDLEVGNRDPHRHVTETRLLDYWPTCGCHADIGRPVVLDPYAGTGTTGRVAMYLGADFVGCELSEQYVSEIAVPRLNTPWKPKSVVRDNGKKPKNKTTGQMEWFARD